MTRGGRAILLAALATAIVAGCGPEKSGPARDPAVEAPPAASATASAAPDDPFAEPIGVSVPNISSRAIAAVRTIGSVPYDDFTLPVIAPNGRRIATQTGLAPDWATILAGPGQTVRSTTRIEVYDIADPDQRPGHVVTLEERLLLGRAADHAGFLVESPREDGTRWIGHASWETGEVAWIVADPARVAAFASLGPRGRVACSVRHPGETSWSLMVRRGDAEEWVLHSEGDDWIAPVWSGVGDGLFVLHRDGGRLEIVYMDATSAESMRRSRRTLVLAGEGATVATALQVLSATASLAEARAGGGTEALAFHHPAHGRAAVWFPGRPAILLDADAIAATVDPDGPDFAMVTTKEDLVRRHLREKRARVTMIRGLHLPRSTADPLRPWVLLGPDEGRIAVTFMKLLPADDSSPLG